MMQRSLSELKSLCGKLGLEVIQSGKREGKKDFVKALQEYYLQNKKQTFGLSYRMQVETPQLCFLSTNLRSDEVERLFNSDQHVAEEKLNGIRMLVTYHPQDGFEFYSRNLSVEDYLPVSYTDKIWIGDQDFRGLFRPFVLDCEIVSRDARISTVMGKRGVVTETILQAVASLLALNSDDTLRIQKELGQPLELKVFDCLMSEGVDIKGKPYYERRTYLKDIVEKLDILAVKVERVKAVLNRKREYLEHIWQMGGEGIVMKPIMMPYLSRESRPRDGWVKFKRTVSGAIGDSVDGFITGFDLGDKDKGYAELVGSLTVSINLIENGNLREHEVARVSNIPLEVRKAITVLVDGKPTLDPVYYQKVVEVDGQAVSAREMRLTHPRLIRFREDKNPDQCLMTKETLQNLIV